MSYDQAYAKKENEQAQELQVKVFSQFRTFFEGTAQSFSATNKTGPFDILPGHANFLSLLQAGTISLIRAGDHQEQMQIERGIIHVNNDSVTVFLDV